MGTAMDVALVATALAGFWLIAGIALVAVPVHIAHSAIRHRNTQ